MMRGKGLVVLVIAGLLVVGHAFYTVLAPRPEAASRSRGEGAARSGARDRGEHEPESGRGVEDDDRDEDDEDARARRPRRVAARPVAPVDAEREPIAAERPVPGPPPRPVPEISLEEARTRFAETMAELDRLAADGAELTPQEWGELYKRGHAALLPLQQHLRWSVPEQADELRRANDDMRAKLAKLEPHVPIPSPP